MTKASPILVVVELPYVKLPIGRKWVCKIKYNADGSFERFKAQLIAKGIEKQKGIRFGLSLR